MSQQTASSLYRQQCLQSQSRAPVQVPGQGQGQPIEPPKVDDKHKTKFCILCDTQYCPSNDGARSNWGESVKLNFGDVKCFGSLFDLPDVHTRDTIPVCPTCIMLLTKLTGYREQLQQIQVLHDKLQLQLATRAIKTCRKYNYNEMRPVHSTVQHIRRNIFRRWNREIGDTSGPIIVDGPPKLEPIRQEGRRKSRLCPRTNAPLGPPQVIPTYTSGQGAPKIIPNARIQQQQQMPQLSPSKLPAPHHSPELPLEPQPYKAKIRHNVLESTFPTTNPTTTTATKSNTDAGSAEDDDSGNNNYQMNEISIIEVQGGGSSSHPEKINFIDIDDDKQPPQFLQVDTSKEMEAAENDNSNEENPSTPTTDTDADSATPKTLKINQSIFDDDDEDQDMNDMSEMLTVKLEEPEQKKEIDVKREHKAGASGIGSDNANKNDNDKDDGEKPTGDPKDKEENKSDNDNDADKKASAISPRVGARKRKPTLRALESEEVMSLIAKRTRAIPMRTTRNRKSTGNGNRRLSESGHSDSPAKEEQDHEQDHDDRDPLGDDSEGGAEMPSQTRSGPSSNSDEDSLPPPLNFTKNANGEYFCDPCDKTFKSKDRYREHMDMHAGQAPICLICNKTFPRKYNLNIHMRTHTGEKPHMCKVCGQPYADKSNLNAHLRKHVDKPYNCLICRKMYELHEQALKHVEQVHPEEIPEDVVTTSHEYYNSYDFD